MGILTGFFYYISLSFKGPEECKFILPDRKLVEIAKQYQPALQTEVYVKDKK